MLYKKYKQVSYNIASLHVLCTMFYGRFIVAVCLETIKERKKNTI